MNSRWMAALLMFAVVSPAGAAFINDDFQTGTGDWTLTPGMNRTDIGGGQFVFTDVGEKAATAYSTNTTPLPAAVQIDMDLKIVAMGYTNNGMRIYFHSRTAGQPNTLKGYQVRYVDDFGTANDGLQLWRKAGDYGTETMLAVANLPVDLNIHHLRITDDGVGLIKLYWDHAVSPVVTFDDSGNFQGGDNTYLSVWPYGSCNAWIDNVVAVAVPEPATLVLLAMSVPIAWRMRRR